MASGCAAGGRKRAPLSSLGKGGSGCAAIAGESSGQQIARSMDSLRTGCSQQAIGRQVARRSAQARADGLARRASTVKTRLSTAAAALRIGKPTIARIAGERMHSLRSAGRSPRDSESQPGRQRRWPGRGSPLLAPWVPIMDFKLNEAAWMTYC